MHTLHFRPRLMGAEEGRLRERKEGGEKGGREGERKREKRGGGREGGREGEMEGGRDGGWEGGREGEMEGGRERWRERWREGGREGGKIIMFTNTYCMYKYPVASLTLNHAITVTTKDRKPSLNFCKLVIPSCHEYVTALPGDSRGSDRHTGRVFNQAGVVVILSTQVGKESKLCEHMRTWVRGREGK